MYKLYFVILCIFLVISCAPPGGRRVVRPPEDIIGPDFEEPPRTVKKKPNFEVAVETVYVEIAKVETVVVFKEMPISAEVFKVQIGAFKEEARANKVYTLLKDIYGDLIYIENIPPYWKIRIGRYGSKDEAIKKKNELRKEGFVDAFVTK